MGYMTLDSTDRESEAGGGAVQMRFSNISPNSPPPPPSPVIIDGPKSRRFLHPFITPFKVSYFRSHGETLFEGERSSYICEIVAKQDPIIVSLMADQLFTPGLDFGLLFTEDHYIENGPR